MKTHFENRLKLQVEINLCTFLETFLETFCVCVGEGRGGSGGGSWFFLKYYDFDNARK